MRLWHEKLLPYLPINQLRGQHRECAALRGLGWGKKHIIVDYVFKYSYAMLFEYHKRVMNEMINRGLNVSYEWTIPLYRGKRCEKASYEFYMKKHDYKSNDRNVVYLEHDEKYLKDCLLNLKKKGVVINI